MCSSTSHRVASDGEVRISRKVAFLRRPSSYAGCPARVEVLETHMSWIFLAGDRAYKLKKPVRTPDFDFTTLPRRRRNALAELRLNRRLAPDVYLGVAPLSLDGRSRLRLGPGGTVVDWLVVMRRLHRDRMLDAMSARGELAAGQLSEVADVLRHFYEKAARPRLGMATLRRRLIRQIAAAETEAVDDRCPVPPDELRLLCRSLRRFLDEHGTLLEERLRGGCMVEGHGDLRPEHICLESPPKIIDCLEFSRPLRQLDPADEIAFLCLECGRIGAGWVEPSLVAALPEHCREVPPRLWAFYKAFRAMVRCTLALRHIRKEPRGRLRWRKRALGYLQAGQGEALRALT